MVSDDSYFLLIVVTVVTIVHGELSQRIARPLHGGVTAKKRAKRDRKKQLKDDDRSHVSQEDG